MRSNLEKIIKDSVSCSPQIALSVSISLPITEQVAVSERLSVLAVGLTHSSALLTLLHYVLLLYHVAAHCVCLQLLVTEGANCLNELGLTLNSIYPTQQ